MEESIHLVGISGSLRKGSFNTFLLNECLQLIPQNTTLEIIGFADIPLYNGDLDLPNAATRPPVVQQFMDKIARADGLLIVSPEYNYSVPGGLKNAIDWASRGGENAPLYQKPVALMGATPGMWGTTRMQLAFQAIFLFLDMKQVIKPEILIQDASKKFDAQGRLIDEKARELVRKKLSNLRELILKAR
jgi:chromate reductase